MKRKALLLPFLMMVFLTSAWGKPVSQQTLDQIAARFFGSVVTSQPLGDEMRLYSPVNGHGFLLLTTDDCVRPVLGYSLTEMFPTESMPIHVLDWIEGRQHDIAIAKTRNGNRHPEWDRLLQGTMKSSGRSVSPLITSTWDQSFPYNSQCPYDSVNEGTSVVGCVAIAIAQVMRFWGHPATGRGSHSYSTPHGVLGVDFGATSYDWSHMPNALTAASTQQEIDAVAQLCYHAGVAVDMEYSKMMSSAKVSFVGSVNSGTAEKALKTYFRYNPTLYGDYRNCHTGAEWDTLCMRQLDKGYPIVYAGLGPNGGHCFVVDGYDSLGFFHVNWGWSGYFDGYFTLDSLDTGDGYSFSLNSQALMEVYPITIDSPRAYIYGVSGDTTQGTVQGGGINYTDSMEVMLLATAAPGYRFDHWTSGNPSNPILTSPTRDFSDTAVFVPLSSDTLGYCSGVVIDDIQYGTDSVSEWGIRIPASYLGFHKQIESVQLYAYSPGLYHLSVYRGESPVTPLRVCDVTVSDEDWYTITLDAPLPLYDTLPLWITVRTEGVEYSSVFSVYSGQPDASWIKIDGSWTLLHEVHPSYVSWLIRAVMAPMDMVHLSVMPNDIAKGDITGGGSYYPGDTVELVATPHPGYHFTEWSTGSIENPYHFVVECDTLVIGYFAGRDGIEEVENGEWSAEIDGLTLTVHNPTLEPLTLYDLQGRQLATLRSPLSTLTLPAPGVYILRSGSTAQKIVAKP